MHPRRTMVLIGIALVVVLSALLFMAKAKGRDDLEKFKAALRAKGEKLTAKELTPHAKPFNAAYGFKLSAASSQLAGLLAGASSARTTLPAETPGTAWVMWQQTNLASSYNGLTYDWKPIAGSREEITEILQSLSELLKEPESGSTPAWNGPKPAFTFVAKRILAQTLGNLALFDLHEHRLDDALHDIHLMIQLHHLHPDNLWLVNQMIRVAMAGLTLDTTWNALQADGWDEGQLEKLQRDWQTVNFMDLAEKALLGERVVAAEFFPQLRQMSDQQILSQAGWSATNGLEASFEKYVSIPLWRVSSSDQDELFCLTYFQSAIENFRLLKARRPWREFEAWIGARNVRFEKILSSPLQRQRLRFSGMIIPNFSKALFTALRSETSRQLTLTAIALKRFHLRHGRLPATLEELIPGYLPELPYDPISGKGLRYKPLETGKFLLYSIGVDGIDDGGDPTETRSNGPRDMVWPSPASAPKQRSIQ